MISRASVQLPVLSSLPPHEKNMQQPQHQHQTRLTSRSPRNPEFQSSLTSLTENIPVLEDSDSHENMDGCSSQRSSFTSLGSQDLEFSEPPLTAPPGSSCDRFGRRPSRRSLRDRNKNPSHHPQQTQHELETEASSQRPPSTISGGGMALTNRRESWKFNTDWDSMLYDSANSSFSCTASQTSLYHVLDELEEQDDENDDDQEEQHGRSSKKSVTSGHRSIHDMLYDEDQSNNDQQNHNQISNYSNGIGGNGFLIDISERTETSSVDSRDAFEMNLGTSLTMAAGSDGRRALPERGLNRKASQKSFRRSIQDTLKQDEDSARAAFRVSCGTNCSGASSGCGADDLEHAFGDLVVDG